MQFSTISSSLVSSVGTDWGLRSYRGSTLVESNIIDSVTIPGFPVLQASSSLVSSVVYATSSSLVSSVVNYRF